MHDHHVHFRVDSPGQTSYPNRHNCGTNKMIKMFLQTDLCAISVHINFIPKYVHMVGISKLQMSRTSGKFLMS